ncbi:TetR/AcrR family transcriptional regulator [Actibacterium sp. XHP0104]|uniref:TetR/AcrR family transcriptional regulator n=1 Tax=Actibacterium sp. XHP0104 TaxID=2984335 RepID=UPI0021E6EB4B|nr:TetR/AcrR family transcriptional regulator [Actibacterium sp. XHP0104]MCV2881879.1 TetR/AcrR family transcriptional regulator [Actibacterium sp. XHP0104]
MTRTRKTAEERQQQIVQAVLDLLPTTPVESLSTTVIARQVGLTQAAIFRHYPTKNAIWAAVLNEIRKRARGSWDEALAGATTPLDRIRAVLAAQLTLITEFPAIPTLLFTSGRVEAEKDIRPVHLAVMRDLRVLLVAELGAVRAEGQVSQPASDQDCADLLMGLIQGTVLRWTLTGHGFDLVAEGRRLIDIQLSLFAKGNLR